MKIDKFKSKTIIIEQGSRKHNIEINDETVEQVNRSTYLGVVTMLRSGLATYLQNSNNLKIEH